MTYYDNVHTLHAFKEACMRSRVHIHLWLPKHTQLCRIASQCSADSVWSAWECLVWRHVCMLSQRMHDEVIHPFNWYLIPNEGIWKPEKYLTQVRWMNIFVSYVVRSLKMAKCSLLVFMGGFPSWLETSLLAHHLALYSWKPQQSVRQRRPFATDYEANAHKS